MKRVYKKLPKGYTLYDPARSLTQARYMANSYPKEAKAIIVQTGESRGKNKAVFPYHIGVKKGWA